MYFRRMIECFGEARGALAAYNARPDALARAGGVPHNAETPAYVARVMLAWNAGLTSTAAEVASIEAKLEPVPALTP